MSRAPFARTLAAVAALWIALAGGCATAPVPEVAPVYGPSSRFEARARRVIIVSFDGLRPDAIERSGARHLLSLETAGAFSHEAQAVYPSITLVNHASMIAGVGPAKHGIDWNSYRPSLGELKVPTVFDLAKKKGFVTAMVVGKEKFIHLNRAGTVDRFVLQDGSPIELARAAIAVLEKERPQLMLVHFRHADAAGHWRGWMSGAQLDAIRQADQAFGHFLRALEALGMARETALIVTADHGGSGLTHGTRDPLDMTIPWIAVGGGIPVHGPIARKITTYDTAATAARLLGLDAPGDWDGKSVF